MTLRKSSARRLLVSFSLIFMVSSSVTVGLCKLLRCRNWRSTTNRRSSSSRYEGVRSGLDAALGALRPFRCLTGGAGNPLSKPPLSSSASVPLVLGDVIDFLLVRESASKYVVPTGLRLLVGSWARVDSEASPLSIAALFNGVRLERNLLFLWYGCGERDSLRLRLGSPVSLPRVSEGFEVE